MDTSNFDHIKIVIDIMKAHYTNKRKEISQKLKNINDINIEALTCKIEEEIPLENIPQNYEKIVSIIESVIQD